MNGDQGWAADAMGSALRAVFAAVLVATIFAPAEAMDAFVGLVFVQDAAP